MAARAAAALLLVAPRRAGAGNHYCQATYDTSASPIVYFELKMNVPIKPKVAPGKVLFLWPGVNPVGGEGGMMQPVLTYGADYGQGAADKWGMANWFTACDKTAYPSGYCHDPYQAVKEGDTITTSMKYISTFPGNHSELWEMRWSALNAGTSSSFRVPREQKNPSEMWWTEAEFYLDSSDPNNYPKLPQSPFITWGFKATRADGSEHVGYPLSTHGNNGSGDIAVDCAWKSSDAQLPASGTHMTFPQNGCPSGFSRDYNFGCQSHCGCNNDDGTHKVVCDYCCQVQDGACHRAVGPTPAGSSVAGAADAAALPHPGSSRRA